MTRKGAHVLRDMLSVAVGALCLTSSARGQQGSIGTGGIKGIIHDSLGIPLIGVEVSLAGSDRRFETDESGKFELSKVPAGPLSLRFRRLGYRPDTIDIMVLAGQSVPLEVRINRVAVNLAPVVVRGRETLTGWRVGFYERREQGIGHYFTRDEIEKRNPSMLTDLFRQVPGARVLGVGNSGFQHVIRFRNERCAPLTWLNGSPLSAGEFDLDALSPRSIEAIEVYSGASTVPIQFRTFRYTGSCGAIIIWSREGELRPRSRKGASSAAAQIAKLVDSKTVFTAAEVDVPAHEDAMHQIRPGYPVSLYETGVAGSVMAEFVVDAGGSVNLDTFSLVFATHPLFTEAVQNALKDATYVPAIRKGYPVLQVVQHEFKFLPDSGAIVRKR